MDIQTLQDFFFWCMIINLGLYIFTVVAVLLMRDFVCRMQEWLFGIDHEDSRLSIQRYIATYKLLITVFNFVPWLALLIINR